MSSPHVSIVLPTYDSASFLGHTIQSVLGQTYRDFELIVLDNASSDSTPEVVAGFFDERIRYVRNDVNLGMVGNINKGLSLVTGKLATILCADDHWDSRFLERSIHAQESHPGLTFTNCVVVRGDRKETYRNVHHGRHHIAAWQVLRHLHGIPLSSLMFPMTGSPRHFDTRLPFNCDLEFVLRSMVQERMQLTFIDWPAVYVTLHDANETLRYDIRQENIKLLGIMSEYVSTPLLRLAVAARRARLRLG